MATRTVETTRFGTLEIPEETVFRFPEGILGFPGMHEYFLMDNPSGGPFRWLHSADAAHLAFVVCDPMVFKPDYQVSVKPADLAAIEISSAGDGRVMVILVVPPDPKNMTANLQGPLIFNDQARLAKQVVLVGTQYHTKHRVFPETEATELASSPARPKDRAKPPTDRYEPGSSQASGAGPEGGE